MFTLFISTFNEFVIIATLKNGDVLNELYEKSDKSHSGILIPTIIKCLNNSKLKVNDLNEIIVVNGPGSFTGVRLGITVAKTLAYTLNIPIKCITSLECQNISESKTINKIIYIEDTKGKYIARFKKDKLIDHILYLNNADFDKYVEKQESFKVLENIDKLDFQKIYKYAKTLKEENPHSVKALYIKNIGGLTW